YQLASFTIAAIKIKIKNEMTFIFVIFYNKKGCAGNGRHNLCLYVGHGIKLAGCKFLHVPS
ncbi:MAG: hypothetical protein LHW62_09245, partial [Candidatus Cloacimonetes bacterium]|nr:hypothetical protein [Candidatus Cloacimonadota bacterium]